MYRNCELRVFALVSTKEFGSEVCQSRSLMRSLDACEDANFPDGESYVRPEEDVRGRDVFVIQSLHGLTGESVDIKIAKLAIFNNAAKYASAARVTDVIPYHAYTRQDRKDKSRAPLSFKNVAKALMSSGADRILGMDWHNPAVQNAYDIPVDILDPIEEFSTYLKGRLRDVGKIVVLAPDVGATERNDELAQRLSRVLEKEVRLAVCLKDRKGGKVKVKAIVGDVSGALTLTYDDESVTGSTFIGASEKARDKGAKEGIAIVTHPKFTKDGIKELEESCLDEIVVTDTVWRPQSFYTRHSKFRKVSVAPLFGEAIRRIHNSESISTLFTKVI